MIANKAASNMITVPMSIAIRFNIVFLSCLSFVIVSMYYIDISPICQ